MRLVTINTYGKKEAKKKFEATESFHSSLGEVVNMTMIDETNKRTHMLTLTRESARKLTASLTGVLLGDKPEVTT